MFIHVRNWIEFADFFVNALTFLVVAGSLRAVINYNRKTGQLVEAAQSQLAESNRQTLIAQEQLKASFKPALIFEFHQSVTTPGRLNLQGLRVKNLGVGTAFNVQIEPTNLPQHSIQFDKIDFVERVPYKDFEDVHFLINGGGSGYASHPALLSEIVQNSQIDDMTISASYADIKGNKYLTEVKVLLDKDAGKVTHFHAFKSL
jgi:hypothetical protein